ncbi:MAG: hypothetical protein MI861_13520 [Pirellulales bacterium]|nr:hypothetical protein [Pirellulales bacterium]
MTLLRRIIAGGCLGLLICGSTGCSVTHGIRKTFTQNNYVDDFMVGYRNRAMAEKAWHQQKPRFCHRKHQKEFKAGFIAGYIDVASGGNGCTPAIAPAQYWGWRYQSAHGQQAVNAWFEGYPMGARAAEEAGVGHWHKIRPHNAYKSIPVAMEGVPHEVEIVPGNPFYSDGPTIVPEMIEHGDAFEEGNQAPLTPPQPNSSYHGPVNDALIGELNVGSDELVYHFGTATSPQAGAVSGGTWSGAIRNDGLGEMISEDAVGNGRAESNVEELPFSFE